MALVIGWTIVGAFLFTTVITCLSLIGWVKFADAKQQRKLFSALIIEVVVAAGGKAVGGVQLDPSPVEASIKSDGKAEADLETAGDMLESSPEHGALPDKERLGRLIGRIRVKPGTPQESQLRELKTEFATLPAGVITVDRAKTLRLKVPAASK